MYIEKERCNYCSNDFPINELYIIYRLLVSTDTQTHTIGLIKLLNELSDYLMNKSYHLSASQVVLLRPDILKDFLAKKYFPEKIIFYMLQESEICTDCYLSYKEYVPLI